MLLICNLSSFNCFKKYNGFSLEGIWRWRWFQSNYPNIFSSKCFKYLSDSSYFYLKKKRIRSYFNKYWYAFHPAWYPIQYQGYIKIKTFPFWFCVFVISEVLHLTTLFLIVNLVYIWYCKSMVISLHFSEVIHTYI